MRINKEYGDFVNKLYVSATDREECLKSDKWNNFNFIILNDKYGFINMYFYIHNDAVYEYVVSKLLKINNAMTVCRLFNSLNKLEQKYRVI